MSFGSRGKFFVVDSFLAILFFAAFLHDTLPQPGQTSMMASSRIFVKNIPSTITEKEFKNHFSANGREITDVKILPHRRIGYVGYKTPDVAENAVKYFNRTFIRMSRVAVELAKPVSSSGPFHQFIIFIY